MPHNSTLMVAMLTILLRMTQSSNKGHKRVLTWLENCSSE